MIAYIIAPLCTMQFVPPLVCQGEMLIVFFSEEQVSSYIAFNPFLTQSLLTALLNFDKYKKPCKYTVKRNAVIYPKI